MKQQWQYLSDSISEFSALFSEFGSGITDVRTTKALRKLVEKWNQIISRHNEFDRIVEPIASLDVRMPFDGDDFREAWILYKEYLEEDHKTFIGSRRESVMLTRLKKLSGSNKQRAIEMLEFFIASGYKNIFKPSDRQLTGEEPARSEAEQSDINITKPKERL